MSDQQTQINFLTATEKTHLVQSGTKFLIEKVEEMQGNYGPQWVLLLSIPKVGARKLSFKKGNRTRDALIKDCVQYGGYWTLNFDPFVGKTGYYFIEQEDTTASQA